MFVIDGRYPLTTSQPILNRFGFVRVCPNQRNRAIVTEETAITFRQQISKVVYEAMFAPLRSDGRFGWSALDVWAHGLILSQEILLACGCNLRFPLLG